MGDEREAAHRAVFIVRLDRDAAGRLIGVVERVRTGEKARVQALADLGPLLALMLARDDARSTKDEREEER